MRTCMGKQEEEPPKIFDYINFTKATCPEQPFNEKH